MLTMCISINAQTVEIQGEAKVSQMSSDNNVDDIVVRKPDGTLATRSAQSLPSSFEDTIRSLNTDFELAKHICDCGTNLPPYLIESLLDAGYSEQDLIQAGVPISNIAENLPVVDIDGNEYDVVTIGTQKWLKQNLKATKFNDGSPIPLTVANADWTQVISDEEPAYAYHDGDILNVPQYGLIYTPYTALPSFNGSKNVCPVGWSVPKRSDFLTLRTFLDPVGPNELDNVAGTFLKTTGSEWTSPNYGANNLTGFDAVPGGQRWSSGSYPFFSKRAYFLTQEFNGSSGTALFIAQLNHDELFLRDSASSITLTSSAIRCIKD